jgi:hypothetical protein
MPEFRYVAVLVVEAADAAEADARAACLNRELGATSFSIEGEPLGAARYQEMNNRLRGRPRTITAFLTHQEYRDMGRSDSALLAWLALKGIDVSSPYTRSQDDRRGGFAFTQRVCGCKP